MTMLASESERILSYREFVASRTDKADHFNAPGLHRVRNEAISVVTSFVAS
jgi:hypothetical protein